MSAQLPQQQNPQYHQVPPFPATQQPFPPQQQQGQPSGMRQLGQALGAVGQGATGVAKTGGNVLVRTGKAAYTVADKTAGLIAKPLRIIGNAANNHRGLALLATAVAGLWIFSKFKKRREEQRMHAYQEQQYGGLGQIPVHPGQPLYQAAPDYALTQQTGYHSEAGTPKSFVDRYASQRPRNVQENWVQNVRQPVSSGRSGHGPG